MSTPLRRTLIRALVTVLITGGLTTAVATPSQAGTCTDTGCNGLYPETARCHTPTSQVRTPYSYTMSDTFTFQIKRSTDCRAAWGRFIEDDCYWPNALHWWLRIESQAPAVYAPGGWYSLGVQTRNMWNQTGSCNGGAATTRMVPARGGSRMRLCFTSTINNTAPSTYEDCSAWIYN
jgi:hypothetical protein